MSPKKQLPVSESATSSIKQAPPPANSLERDSRSTVSTVTAIKKEESQDKSSDDESSEEGSSAQSKKLKKEGEEESQYSGSDGDKSFTESKSGSQTKMSTIFDAKLEHVLTNYLSSTTAQHDIQQAFIYEGILTFETFTDMCSLENLKTMQRQSGTNVVQTFTN